MGPMIKVTVNKHRVTEILQRIQAGEPIEPQTSAWALADCLTVAGVLLSSALAARAHVQPSQHEPQERADQKLKHLEGAIEFIGAMTNAHTSGTWDEFFDDTVTIGIGGDTVTPIAGFKS